MKSKKNTKYSQYHISKDVIFTACDLFSGLGGQTVGLNKAGFKTIAAVELDSHAVKGYRLNHKETKVFSQDIRKVDSRDISVLLKGKPLHLLASCPPCQGFSSMRKLNKKTSARDDRNSLVKEFYRMVIELTPLTVMMENVPGLQDYYLFKEVLEGLKLLGYNPKVKVVNVKDYGVPQSRRRLILVGSLLGDIDIAPPTNEKMTVRKAIGKLENTKTTKDPAHKININFTPKVLEKIQATPHDGGGRKDLPKKFELDCHKKKGIGFNDIYGRLRWDDYSSTITGGCLNPSKGRFLHPVEDRVITPREAALLQTFPRNYKLPLDIPKQSLALLIGNALPPKFSYIQSKNILAHIKEHLSVY